MNRLTSAIIICAALVLLFFTILGDHGVLRLLQVNAELKDLDEQNNKLESEIIEIKNKSFAIGHSDFALEQNAREQLGLSKPGEIIYIFSQPEKNQETRTSAK
jgi:cell division protein FtsB